jgi:hypothetical protein
MFIAMSIFNFFDSLGSVAKVYGKAQDSVEKWNTEATVSNNISKVAERVVEIFYNTPGMTLAHSRDFKRATPLFTLRDGTIVKIYQNPVKVDHVFVSDKKGKMVFGGFVNWSNSENLRQSISIIKKELS